MGCLKVFLLLFWLFLENDGATNQTASRNAVYTKFAENCPEVMTTHSYAYSKFYHLTKAATDENHEFMMKFTVLAGSNAHILLTPAPEPGTSDPVYEIVPGAGKNTFSDIRRAQRAGSKKTAPTLDLLSTTETRGFWVRLSKDGMLAIGKWGEDLPFLYWQDPDPLPIRYFSFATWTSVWGTWRFNCVDNLTDEATGEEVIHPLSMHEKLRRDLLTDYDPYAGPSAQPNQRTTVFMDLSCHRITIDSRQSVLLVDGVLTMQWTDEKLNWRPDDYQNLTYLHIEHHEIWQPEIILYNAAASHGADILGDAALKADFDGIVTWRPSTQLDAWCDVDLTDWPNDQQLCQLQLGLWSQDQLLELAIMASGKTLPDQHTGSEWELLELLYETTWTKTPWTDREPDSGTEVPFSAITLQFTLKRKNQASHLILVGPLFLFAILSIVPFFMSPYSAAKLTVLGTDVLLLSAFLLAIGTALPAPADHLPNIVLAYILGLLSVTFSIVVSIVGICFVRYNHKEAPPTFIHTFLSARPIRKILFLPEIRRCKVGLLQEVTSDAAKLMSAAETAQHWFILSKAMDRTMCFLNTVFWAVILAHQN